MQYASVRIEKVEVLEDVNTKECRQRRQESGIDAADAVVDHHQPSTHEGATLSTIVSDERGMISNA